VALSLENAQTLAIGPFNPYIITPEWLVKQGVCADEEVEIRVHPLKQGLAFTFKDVDWRIDFRLLVVASRKENCGELVAKVIHDLPHTPVRAIANNFSYACSREAWGPSPFLTDDNCRLPGVDTFGSVEETRWAWVIRSGDTRIDLTVAKEDSGMAVLFNFHREPKGSADEARRAAECFEIDRRKSRDLLQHLFNQEVEG
jgi:hypothetical protein